MATVAAPKAPPKRRRGGMRILVVLALVLILIVAGVIWLNVAAQAQVNVSGILTVYQPTVSTAHGGGAYTAATPHLVVQAGDSVQTDAKGSGAINLADGTGTRLAHDTTITLNSAHFTKGGNLLDVSLTQGLGRTFTNLQHLVSGATFDVHGKSATASVRGTKFEVLTTSDGKMTVKLFQGILRFHGINSVNLVAGQQATADANGNVGPAGPIQADAGDPFGPALDASNGESPFVAVASVESCVSAIPGTEQNGAVHRAYTAQNLIDAVQQSGQVSGLSNLKLPLAGNSVAGAIVNASGTYNGVSWSGSVVLVAHDGVLDIVPTSGTIFGLSVPAQQLVQQISATIGQDPSNLDPGFTVDRLFTCNSVMMVDGRMS